MACYRGEEVLGCVDRHDPDVVLLDLRMPVVDGFTAAIAIRARYGRKRPMLIAITAEYPGDGSIEQRATASGFDHYFLKPPNSSALSAILRRVGQ